MLLLHGCMTDDLVCCWTGTNFLVRSNALLEVGGSPQYTLTEDFALGMEMKKYGWHCRYVQEYLAIGEAPDQIRNCYQQRSRWCKVCAKTQEMTKPQKEKEKTTLLSVIEEKPMVNLSFPLA